MPQVTCVGHTHEVLKQTKTMSCGPTCLQMAHQRCKGSVFPESLVFSLASIVQLSLSTDYTGDTGTSAGNLATMAKGLGLNAKAKACSDVRELIGEIGRVGINYPCVMASIRWNGGGGHAVLIDKSKVDLTTLTETICVCDPWDGAVHRVTLDPYQTTGSLSYNPGYATGTFTGVVITFAWR